MVDWRGIVGPDGWPLMDEGGTPLTYDADLYPDGPPAECCCPSECPCPAPPSELMATYTAECEAVIDGCVAPLSTSDAQCAGSTEPQCWAGLPEQDVPAGCGDVLNHRLVCDEDGEYVLRVTLCNVTGVGFVDVPMTVVSCDPF